MLRYVVSTLTANVRGLIADDGQAQHGHWSVRDNVLVCGQLVDCPTQLICAWIFICVTWKAKRTQQGNLLVVRRAPLVCYQDLEQTRDCFFCFLTTFNTFFINLHYMFPITFLYPLKLDRSIIHFPLWLSHIVTHNPILKVVDQKKTLQYQVSITKTFCMKWILGLLHLKCGLSGSRHEEDRALETSFHRRIFISFFFWFTLLVCTNVEANL